MAKKIYEESKIAAIAEKIREKTGGTETYTTAEMPSGVDSVYEAGEKSERDAFWDIFQNRGGESNYYYAFAYGKFTDENYNPQHDIVCQSNTNTSSQYMFYNAKQITDTKVPIYANGTSAACAFYGCEKLRRIPKLVVHEKLTLTDAFYRCSELVELGIEGVIGKSVSFSSCHKLNKESIEGIITALSDTASGQTLTLSNAAVVNAFAEKVYDNKVAGTWVESGITFTYDGNGTFTANGTATEDVMLRVDFNRASVIDEVWMLEVDGYAGDFTSYWYGTCSDKYGGFVLDVVGYSFIFTVTKEGGNAYILMYIFAGTTVNDVTFTPCLSITGSEWDELKATKPNWTISLV